MKAGSSQSRFPWAARYNSSVLLWVGVSQLCRGMVAPSVPERAAVLTGGTASPNPPPAVPGCVPGEP